MQDATVMMMRIVGGGCRFEKEHCNDFKNVYLFFIFLAVQLIQHFN